MNTPQDRLKALLTDLSDGDTPVLAPQALQAAFAWCAEVVTPARLAGQSRVDLLTILAELVKALHAGRDFLSLSVPGVLERAVAGERLRAALREGEAAVAKGVRQIEQVQRALAPLLQQEEMLRTQACEYEALKNRYVELERLSGLAQHVAELTQQVEVLEHNFSTAGREAKQREEQIEQRARQFIVLSEKAQKCLQPEVRDVLALAEQRERERRAMETQLRTAMEHYQQAHTALEKLHTVLRPHVAADRAIAQAVAGTQRATALLDEAERLLQQADEALQAALKTQAETQKLSKVFLAGEEA